jgi:hypothetical protein
MSNGTANGYFPDLQHADIHQPRARKPINAAVARAFAQDAAVHDVSALARYGLSNKSCCFFYSYN